MTDSAAADPSAGPAAAERELRPAVFLDRDGTLVREVDFLREVHEVELIPGAGRALAELAAAGYALVVVTNQSGVARGYLDEVRLAEIHGRMEDLLAAEGVHLDLILYCPHHPDVGPERSRVDCACRKPKPGMLLEAIERLELDPSRSWTVGDSLRDLEAGAVLGIPGILVATGKGAAQYAALAPDRQEDVLFVQDMAAAAGRILAST